MMDVVGLGAGGALAEGGPPEDHNGTGRGSAVLIVEDEPIIALALEATLEDLGFKDIHVAHTLDEAAALLAAHPQGQPFALALLDVNVGDALVFPLAEELRRRGVPFAFSTGRHPRDLPETWRHHLVISKPADDAALTAAIGALGFRWTGSGWERAAE